MDKQNNVENLILKLYEIGSVKFGSFVMKTGEKTPVYFDFRLIIGYPDILESIAELLCKNITDIECDLLCGVPYSALPIATIMSQKLKLPMLIKRKEVKSYGTKKLIEGIYKTGDKCIIIEDVITSGTSVLETVNVLKNEGIGVDQAFVILDRQQGAISNLKKKDINVKSLITTMSFLDVLLKKEKIDNDTYEKIKDYVENNKIEICKDKSDRLKMPYEERLKLVKNLMGKDLFNVMLIKRSNLCIAADLTSSDEILSLLEKTGPYICLFKIHSDIIIDMSEIFIENLKDLASKYNVLLMEDRKYADIGNTVSLQCSNSKFGILKWANLVTVHCISGPGVLKGIRNVFNDQLKGIFIVAEMSSQGNLVTPDYVKASMDMIDEGVVGVVCQNKEVLKQPGLIQLTPGVSLNNTADKLGQKYCTPEEAINIKGADIVVVGRGIIQSSNPAVEALKYRDILWQCYESRVKE